jgi:hypothetical protein
MKTKNARPRQGGKLEDRGAEIRKRGWSLRATLNLKKIRREAKMIWMRRRTSPQTRSQTVERARHLSMCSTWLIPSMIKQ